MFFKKRGQTTLFIIIGLVILIIIGILFYFRGNLGVEGGEVSFTSKVNEIRFYTQDCIDNTVKNGLVFINEHGGYYNVPSHLMYEDSVFLYKDGPQYLTDEEIKKNIENYVKDNLDECIDDYDVFKKSGYDVKYGDAVVEVELSGVTNVKVKYPVIIKKGNENAELFNEFENVAVKDGLKESLDAVSLVVNEYDGSIGAGENQGCDDDGENWICSWPHEDDDIIYKFTFVLGPYGGA